MAPYGYQWFELVEPIQTLAGEFLLAGELPREGSL
jgi:hypothetical protein